MTDPTQTSPEAGQTETQLPAGWPERVGAFATACGTTIDVITLALEPVVGAPSQDALDILNNPEFSPDSDLKNVLVDAGPKIALGKFRKNLSLLRGPKPTVAAEPATQRGPSLAVLPDVPDDASFLEMLKVGGVLKVGVTEVISAMKAALAYRLGLYNLPSVLSERMEDFATSQGDPCGESFYRLQKMVTEHNYGEILSALNVTGRFVSVRRKTDLMQRLEGTLWTTLYGFHKQLLAWQKAWADGAANPAMMLAAFAALAGGGGMMPPGMMEPPETSALRDGAEAAIEVINKIFAGTGIPVARALAWDANRIKEVLEEPTLPTMIGAANKEQMLKMLNVAVGADYVRLERNIVRWSLAMMELPKVTQGQEEYAYLAAMIQLGAAIPWDTLTQAPNRSRNNPFGVPREE